MEPLIKGGIYKHYKGAKYLIRGFGRDTDHLEEFVIYSKFYGDVLENECWLRKQREFSGHVLDNKRHVKRFVFIGLYESGDETLK